MVSHNQKKIKFKIKTVSIIITIIVIIILVKKLTISLFCNRGDRVNILFYGKNITYYSLSSSNSYYFSFPADYAIDVPGGYGIYRVGALGKLNYLEKDPSIFIKSFSSATNSFVDKVFYENSNTIYYGTKIDQQFFPGIRELIFSKSNGNIFDKVYVFVNLILKRRNSFRKLENLPYTEKNQMQIQDINQYIDSFQGYFYKKLFRNEKKTVQIIYSTSYKTALLISRILEGEGIRVVDISQKDNELSSCIVTEKKNKQYSITASEIGRFFNCVLKDNKSETSDIIFTLGELEEKWSAE